MKRNIVIILLVMILSLGLVIAQPIEDEDISGTEKDANKVLELGQKGPMTEDGEFNKTAYKPYTSKAEIRINAINEAIEENVGWMGKIFGMVPAISWAFVIDIWFILLGILYFLLNTESCPLLRRAPETARRYIIGPVLFIGLLLGGIYAWLAVNIVELLENIFGAGAIWGIISTIIFIGLMILLMNLSKKLKKMFKKSKEKEEKEEEKAHRKELKIMTGGLEKNP